MKVKKLIVACLIAALTFQGVSVTDVSTVQAKEIVIEQDVPDLRDAMTAQMGENFLAGGSICLGDIADENTMALVTKHFNAVTFGNELKPDAIFNYSNNKCPGTQEVTLNGETITVPVTDFSRAEKMLEYFYKWNTENPDRFIKIRGHVLTWHSQTPEWFFHEDYDASKPYVSPEEMSKRHEWYIKTVLEHFVGPDSKYKDMFYGWDVVNEAVSDSKATYRNDKENSSWWAVYGSQEFIINAFRFANKYAPQSLELYYNDYGDASPQKSKGIVQLLKDVKEAEGTRIDGMGMQGHYQTVNDPSIENFKKAAKAYAEVVGKVQLTELDFQASKQFDGTDATLYHEHAKLGERYKAFYDAVMELQAEGVDFTGITVWGVVDKNSWLQHASFVGGGSKGNRRQVPLLFDDNYMVKPAFWAFVDGDKMAEVIEAYDLQEIVEEVVVKEEKVKPEPDIEVPMGKAVIDGEIDDSWSTTNSIPLTVRNGAKCDATAKILWDEDNLYVLVDVKDSVLNADNGNEYEKDSVEIFIDERNHKDEAYREDDKQYRINYLNELSFNGDKCSKEYIESAVKLTDSGYIVEARIDFTNLFAGYNTIIGLDLQVNDADKSGKRIGTLNWYDKSGTGYMDPSVFGTVKLVKKLDKVVESTVTSAEQNVTEDAIIQGEETTEGNIFSRIANWFKSLFN